MSWYGIAFTCAAGVMLCANLDRVLRREQEPSRLVVVVMVICILLAIIFLFRGC